ncbi:MAG: HDOD domain-containing protein [Acidimicrobiales bacterium]
MNARATTPPEPTTARLALQPLTARAVLRSVTDPEASSGHLSRLVELDPALSATVLRMANSPFFGVSGRVGGARQAVVMLGVKSVGSLAISRTAALVFSDDDTCAPHGYWTHSITTAVACSVLAPLVGVADDEAFTTGLLHDIGSLISHNNADEKASSDAISDHVALGAEILLRWGLPRTTVSALRLLYADPSVVHEPVARLLIAGHSLAVSVLDDDKDHWSLSPREVLSLVGAAPSRLDELVNKVNSEVDRIATFITGAAA